MKEVWASDCTDERAWRNVQNFPDTTLSLEAHNVMSGNIER
jgi:hypothetical protein